MGMYDNINIPRSILPYIPNYMKLYANCNFQTTDLASSLTTYQIDIRGNKYALYDIDGKLCSHITRTIRVHDNNGNSHYRSIIFTLEGEPYEAVDYNVSLVSGIVESIEQIQYESEMALHADIHTRIIMPYNRHCDGAHKLPIGAVGRILYYVARDDILRENVIVEAESRDSVCIRFKDGSIETVNKESFGHTLWPSKETYEQVFDRRNWLVNAVNVLHEWKKCKHGA